MLYKSNLRAWLIASLIATPAGAAEVHLTPKIGDSYDGVTGWILVICLVAIEEIVRARFSRRDKRRDQLRLDLKDLEGFWPTVNQVGHARSVDVAGKPVLRKTGIELLARLCVIRDDHGDDPAEWRTAANMLFYSDLRDAVRQSRLLMEDLCDGDGSELPSALVVDRSIAFAGVERALGIDRRGALHN